MLTNIICSGNILLGNRKNQVQTWVCHYFCALQQTWLLFWALRPHAYSEAFGFCILQGFFPDSKLKDYGRERRGTRGKCYNKVSKEKCLKGLLISLIISFLQTPHFSSFLKLLCIYNKFLLYHICTLPYPPSSGIKLPCHLQQSGSSNGSTLLFVMILNLIFHKSPFSQKQNFPARAMYSFRV